MAQITAFEEGNHTVVEASIAEVAEHTDIVGSEIAWVSYIAEYGTVMASIAAGVVAWVA